MSIGGCGLAEVADRFGTPALVVDEGALRERARTYRRAFADLHPDSGVLFATKAFPSASVLAVLAEEGLGLDVASGNELAVAIAAGVDPGRAVLHGNAKTDEEIAFAMSQGIGHIVIDNLDDVGRIRRLAGGVQPVLLRVAVGVEADTHEAMATGGAASKFGVGIDVAGEVIELIRKEPTMRLDGLHAHIGSQIFSLAQFRQEVARLAELGSFPVYDLGGGLAARYTSEDGEAEIGEYAKALVGAAHEFLGEEVRLLVEPGRSMVAPTAVSLYTVVTVKRGRLVHVGVDGGMGDNLEVSLYGQRFQPWVLDRDRPAERCDLVGHHCESGDVLATNVDLATPEVGDRVVIPVTGAYTYTMSNNYNAAFRPPVIFCRDGEAREVVRRETMDDLLARELTIARPGASGSRSAAGGRR
ncbi:MAG: diaminopimelate decarboxylase [Actinobacteria bacterium]|nr:diaminopimelate decarboxylase [Actinomycetota bacterium]